MFAQRENPSGRLIASPVQHTPPRQLLARHGVLGASAAMVAFAVVLGGGLFSPASAHAEIPVVGPVAKAIGGGIHTVLHPAEAAVEALVKVLQAIFGGVEAKLITGVIDGLLAIPNFDTGHVAELEHTTVAISGGMLSAVLTLSILRYYLAGLSDSGSGGFEAIQGLIRVVGAVGFIIAWPGVFSEIIQIPKAFDAALLGSGSVQHSVALLFDAALVVGTGAFAISGGLGLIFVVLIAFIAAVVFIALLWMKVMLSVTMMFLYVSMPLCIVLWPVQELSWLAVAAMRSLFVALVVPCVWAILFSLSSAVNADVLSWAPSHSIIDTVIIRPLAGITLMLLCITIPRFLMRTAMIGPSGQAAGGWKMWRTVTFGMFAMRGAAGAGRTVAAAATEGHATAKRMIDALPTQVQPPSGPGQGSRTGRIVFANSGYPQDTKTDKETNKPPTPGTTGGGGPANAPDAAAGTPGSKGMPSGMRLEGVTPPASYVPERVDRAAKEMGEQAQSQPSSASRVTSAMGKLPAQTQHAIADFNTKEKDGEKLRDLMAHNLHSSSLSEDQHKSLWTIGTARNREAGQGIQTAIANLPASQSAPQQSAANPAVVPSPSTSGPHTASGPSKTASPTAGSSSSGPPAVTPPPPPGETPTKPSTSSPAAASPPRPPAEASAVRSTEPSAPSAGETPRSSGGGGGDGGGGSLGSHLPQQQQPPRELGGSGETAGPVLGDIEPFLD